jgi:anti-sigma-K factor RskA
MTDGEVEDSMQREMNSLVAAYVLDALPPDEREVFEAFLDGSPTAAQEVAELLSVSAVLGAVDAAAPAPGLRESVLSAVGRTRQLPRITRRSDAERTPGQPVAGQPVPAQPVPAQPVAAQPVPAQPVAAQPVAVTRRRRAAVRVAAAFALAAVLVLGVVVSIQADRLAEARRETQAAQGALALSSITGQADMQTRTSAVASGGTATVLSSARAGRGVVLLAGVTTLATDKTYELWLIDAAGKPRPVTTFATDNTTATVDFAGFRTGDSVGLSVEPAGGSPTGAPTTTPVLAVKVA